jgi:hypothetical protein
MTGVLFLRENTGRWPSIPTVTDVTQYTCRYLRIVFHFLGFSHKMAEFFRPLFSSPVGKAVGVGAPGLTHRFFSYVRTPSFILLRPCNVAGWFSVFPIQMKTTKHFHISYGRAPGDWNKQAYRPKRIGPLSKNTASLTFLCLSSQ